MRFLLLSAVAVLKTLLCNVWIYGIAALLSSAVSCLLLRRGSGSATASP